jgi:muramoyltetrapeptide carboxypeptidase
MNPILAKRLHPGDTLGLICPASAPPDPKTVDQSIAALEQLGFKVKLGRHVRKRWGFLAGRDHERAADLMHMFANPRVDGIVCLRGGYGTPRLLPLLDYRVIRRNPKVFVGFSDITTLHCAFLLKSNLLSFHGPMTASHLVQKDTPEFTIQSWQRMLLQPEPFGSILKGYKGKTVKALRGGRVSAQLIGGNLTLLSSLLGTPYQPQFKNCVLFFEEVDERPFRMDRLLTQFLNAGILQRVKGVAVGICHDCHDPKAKPCGEFRQSLEDVLKNRLLPLEIPVVTGLPFGHVPYNATLPVGGRATLDADAGDLILTSAAVR